MSESGMQNQSQSQNRPGIQRPFDVVVFDLDDTLLDTWGQLVPVAARESCTAMIRSGLDTDLDSCLRERKSFIEREPRGNVYRHLTGVFTLRDGVSAEQVATAGFDAFYQRDVGTNLALFDGAHALLSKLRDCYTLYLVTAGNQTTQAQKVRLLDLEKYFAGINYVDPSRGESKKDAFRSIMAAEGLEPARFLSVGNRVDSDIAEAKVLGWNTCWVRYGEYAHLEPTGHLETPDFRINHITELADACRL